MNKQELLHVASSMAKDHHLEREEVFQALEGAMAQAIATKYGHHEIITVEIKRDASDILAFRKREIVPDEEFISSDYSIASLSEAHKIDPSLKIGDELKEQIPSLNFDRVMLNHVLQGLMRNINDMEKAKQYNDYKHLEGTIITGAVKYSEFSGVTIELGQAEGYMPKDQTIYNERLRIGDRVKVHIKEVKEDTRNHQITLSRASNEFLCELLKEEIPEIEDGTIEIKTVARDPGSRSKVAIYTDNSSIDPIGSCVGLRGIRIQAISNYLNGEKIDVFIWDPQLENLAARALTKARVLNATLIDPSESGLEGPTIEIVVDDEHLSGAIGRNGQNVKLVSKLVGMKVNIISETKAKELSNKIFSFRSDFFAKALELDNLIGQILTIEGFISVGDITQCTIEELENIESFDNDISNELITRAKQYLAENENIILNRKYVMDSYPQEAEEASKSAPPAEKANTETTISDTKPTLDNKLNSTDENAIENLSDNTKKA